jgi:hypothetical protein
VTLCYVALVGGIFVLAIVRRSEVFRQKRVIKVADVPLLFAHIELSAQHKMPKWEMLNQQMLDR